MEENTIGVQSGAVLATHIEEPDTGSQRLGLQFPRSISEGRGVPPRKRQRRGKVAPGNSLQRGVERRERGNIFPSSESSSIGKNREKGRGVLEFGTGTT